MPEDKRAAALLCISAKNKSSDHRNKLDFDSTKQQKQLAKHKRATLLKSTFTFPSEQGRGDERHETEANEGTNLIVPPATEPSASGCRSCFPVSFIAALASLSRCFCH